MFGVKTRWTSRHLRTWNTPARSARPAGRYSWSALIAWSHGIGWKDVSALSIPRRGRGRRPYELSAMLRIHCVQLFYNLSDPGMEDMLYEVESVRRFVGLRLSGPLPDETTILNFRHLLEEHELGEVCSKRSTVIWSPRDCGFGRGRSWTRASSRHRRRRRIVLVVETLRCVRRRRGMSGTLG